MSDFEFLQNPTSKKWIVSAPRRAQRPDEAKGTEGTCPFCPGKEGEETEVYRVGGKTGDSNWQVRVLPNKYPFAPIHEVIVHSQDHHKNFGELETLQVELILKVYKDQFIKYKDKGQVYIFHNRGEAAGESLTHPHSQLAVIPSSIELEIPALEYISQNTTQGIKIQTFILFCPLTSQWPDEVWIVPSPNENSSNLSFADITDQEIKDLSQVLTKLVQVLEKKLGKEFPYNFYIYPGKNWYLRLIPRIKSLGGFEIGTNVFVNTEDPRETIKFLKENF